MRDGHNRVSLVHKNIYVSPCLRDMHMCHHASMTCICVTMPQGHVYVSPCLTDIYLSPCHADMYMRHHASLTRICVTMLHRHMCVIMFHWHVYVSPCHTDMYMCHDASLTHICVTMPHWHVYVSRCFTDMYMCHHASLTRYVSPCPADTYMCHHDSLFKYLTGSCTPIFAIFCTPVIRPIENWKRMGAYSALWLLMSRWLSVRSCVSTELTKYWLSGTGFINKYCSYRRQYYEIKPHITKKIK